MRFTLATLILASAVATGSAFAPHWGSASRNPTAAFSTIEQIQQQEAAEEKVQEKETGVVDQDNFISSQIGGLTKPVTGAELKERLSKQLEKLREKDSQSIKLSKEDIKVVYQDDHIIVVDKPAGVLTVAGKGNYANLAQAVGDAFGCQLERPDNMIVHRLGMDTSGLIILAKTIEAVRGMNAIFRARNIEKQYEALVCGHIAKDEGMIDLPLMRDYEFPPFMRVSTNDHQHALCNLDVADVGKKMLEGPKDSLTKYQVVAREELNGQPVTRVALTSISGRTHQLNVHLAAFGHPIVGDSTYGIDGCAAPNGGLTNEELEALVPNSSRASAEVQKSLVSNSSCVHAKSLKFRHPVTKEDISLSSNAPF